jgi:outer membrane protein TolC
MDMKRYSLSWAFVLALGLPAGLMAQQPGAPPRQVPVGLEEQDRYEVGRALPPADSGTTIVPLTLEQAIQRALENNLDLQSARLNPLMQEYSLQAARAVFAPTFTSTMGYNNASTQSTSQLDGGARTSTQRHTVNLGIQQPLPWYGGRLTTSFNNSRTETDNAFSTRNPSYSSSFSLNYSMPLLSGLRIDGQRNALRTQEIQQQITDLQLDAQLQNVTDQVRVAYWSLRSLIEQIEIQRRSLAQAERLLADNQIRVQQGRLAPIEIVQAEAQVAAAQQALLNAEIQWRNQELAFKRLLVNGPQDPLFRQTLNPVDLPTFQEQTVDIDAAVEVALSERSDVRQQRQQREIAELNLDVTREELIPDLSLTTGYSLSGVGGDLFDRSGLGGAPQLIQEGGYLDGLTSIKKFDTPTWNVSLNFSYPLGTKAAKANVERAQLQMRQTDLAMRSLELQIVTEVTNAGLAVSNTFLQLQAATRSREAAERAAEAELARFNVGASTNFQVVGTQNTLTSARLSELRSLINHINAIAEFDRVQRVGR